MADLWQIEYKLYIKFACSYLKEYNAIPGTIEHGFLMTIYGDDLQSWSLERMRELTAKASRLRANRKLDTDTLNEIKLSTGYKQLITLMRNYAN